MPTALSRPHLNLMFHVRPLSGCWSQFTDSRSRGTEEVICPWSYGEWAERSRSSIFLQGPWFPCYITVWEVGSLGSRRGPTILITAPAGGYLAHSLAIMTDAAHLLTDFASMLISLFSLWMSSRPATKTMNFGWQRAGEGPGGGGGGAGRGAGQGLGS